MLRRDETWQVFLGQVKCGHAEDAEAGMWACVCAWMRALTGRA
jgi:hypothetical protein